MQGKHVMSMLSLHLHLELISKWRFQQDVVDCRRTEVLNICIEVLQIQLALAFYVGC